MNDRKVYSYDDLGNLISVSSEMGLNVTYTYDKAGNRISTARSGGAGSGVPVMSTVQAEPRSQTTTLPPSPAAQQLCGNCGTPVKSGKKFCSTCGAPVSAPAPAAPVTAALPPSLVCAACGNPIKPGAKFCAKCGRRCT